MFRVCKKRTPPSVFIVPQVLASAKSWNAFISHISQLASCLLVFWSFGLFLLFLKYWPAVFVTKQRFVGPFFAALLLYSCFLDSVSYVHMYVVVWSTARTLSACFPCSVCGARVQPFGSLLFEAHT